MDARNQHHIFKEHQHLPPDIPVVSQHLRRINRTDQNHLPTFEILFLSRYCKCEMPYNPDDLMIQCDGCSDWFHPTCMDMSPEEAERLDHFYCLICSLEDEKKSNNSRVSSRGIDVKVVMFAKKMV